MANAQPGRITELWYKWKSLRLPWRRKWLVGRDLTGTTFWELHSPLSPSRPRRIAQPARSTVHYADVAHSPAWMQWLRHTRPAPPSLSEQRAEVTRQRNLQQLAAAADARWAEKPSFLDRPAETRQLGPGTVPRDQGAYGGRTEGAEGEGVRNAVRSEVEVEDMAEGRSVDRGRFRGETAEEPRDMPAGGEVLRDGTEAGGGIEAEDPWKRSDKSSSEGWQPQTWQPPRSERR